MSKRPTIHLVIGDAHSHPEVSNERFTWLANLISEIKPDVVVDIGDSADMASLFGADKNNLQVEFEQRRYKDDIDCYLDSRSRLAKMKAKPRLVKCLGNHEYRVEKWLRSQPKLRGFIGMKDFQDHRFGWHVEPFLRPIQVDGVLYVHYWCSPGSERPIGGQIRNLLAKKPGSHSKIWGHTHRFEFAEVADGGPNGRKITAINCGMFADPRDKAHEWAGENIHDWRSGILTHEVSRGQISGFRWYSMEEIQRDYA